MKSPIQEAFEAILPAQERAQRMKGREVDHYIIGNMMEGGVGGFGVVYRARHPEIGDVAIKVLAVDIKEDPQAYERFRKEVALLRDLGQAANIVRIHHAGVVDDMPWYAMELVEGMTLDRWLAARRSSGKPVTRRQLLGILDGVLEGLHQVQAACRKMREHARRTASDPERPDCIVHRDIKPGNIMVNELEDGSLDVRLIDFGIAGLFRTGVRAGAWLTQATLTAKTPDYASPEMWFGPQALDVRSDIFQVGLLAFEIISGQRYWSTWPQGLSEFHKVKHWPRWLKQAILRSLHWDRDERYGTAQDFGRKLAHPLAYGLTLRELWHRKARSIALLAALLATALAAFAWNGHRQLQQAEASAADLRARNEQMNQDRLERAILTSTGEQGARLIQIRELYAALEACEIKDPKEDNRLRSLQEKCRQFVALYPADDAVGRVRALRSWLDNYLAGGLQIIPKRFENWGKWDKWMHYKVVCGEQVNLEYSATVKGYIFKSSEPCPLDFNEQQTTALGWNVPVDAQIVLEANGRTDSRSVSMRGPEAINRDSDPRTLYLSDGDCLKLCVEIRRLNFGPLPPKP